MKSIGNKVVKADIFILLGARYHTLGDNRRPFGLDPYSLAVLEQAIKEQQIFDNGAIASKPQGSSPKI